MPLCYDPPVIGALRQGELLANVWVHSVSYPSVALADGERAPIDSVVHAYLFVMSPDCDLDWDFKSRTEMSATTDLAGNGIIPPHKTMFHVLVCDAYEGEHIRGPEGLVNSSQQWRRVIENQELRFHYFPSAVVANQGREVSALCVDFKRSFGLPVEQLYAGIRMEGVNRVARVPPIFLQNLIQRYYSFLSRVGIPE